MGSHRFKVIVSIMFLLAFLNNLHSAAVTVGLSGCDHTTLTAALDTGSRDDIHILGPLLQESGIKILHDVRIIGIGDDPVTISAEQLDRVFEIAEGVTVTCENLIIRDGNPAETERCGGGILNYGNVTLDRCIIESNRAVYGAGIINFGKMTIRDSIIRDNHTIPMTTAERLSAEGCTGSGGGIKNDAYAELEITSSEISGNRSLRRGGGLFVSCESEVTISDTTFRENYSERSGGAVHIRGDLDLFNCLITGNSSKKGAGGLHNQGHLDITGTTIMDNPGGDYHTGSGGGFYGTGKIGTASANTIGEGSLE